MKKFTHVWHSYLQISAKFDLAVLMFEQGYVISDFTVSQF